MLPLVEGLPPRHTASYAEIRELAFQAEASGFDSIWLSDHLLFRGPGYPATGAWEAWTILSAIADATSRVELGTMVISAGFRNPGLLAKMAVTLDEVSGGRLILGLGAGSQESDYRPFGFEFDRRFERFEEFLDVLLPLLRDGSVRHMGRWYQVDAPLRPAGPRNGRIPILIAGSGPRMLGLVARHADAWNPAGFDGPPTALLERIADLRDRCRDGGRDPRSLAITAVLVIEPNVPAATAGPASDQPSVHARAAMHGDPTAIAEGLAAWAAAGVDHAVVDLRPATLNALRIVADAIRRFRSA